MVSTPFVSVPPPRYGGTELIVAELVTGLAAAGHEVTLFAPGDSHVRGCELRPRFARASWPPAPYVELAHAGHAVEEILADARSFDVVHTHAPSLLAFARMLDAPVVYTVHHADGADYQKLAPIYERSRVHFVAISERQRALMPALADASVIHHGLDAAGSRLGAGNGGYCAFLGRLARDKGPHVAIDAARAARVPIRVAGAPHEHDHEYFEREIGARLCASGVTAVGELGGADKRAFLAAARALLFPVDWEEPFGLVMIEAMLAGTPVLAFARGSVPEIVDDGVTGFICRDADDMAKRLRALSTDGGFDRAACRARALERWTSARMVRDYVALYERVHAWVGDVRAAETVA
ncbi:MAG TPA: glycosyltransferase family 4 protein [Polyangia bacterium]